MREVSISNRFIPRSRQRGATQVQREEPRSYGLRSPALMGTGAWSELTNVESVQITPEVVRERMPPKTDEDLGDVLGFREGVVHVPVEPSISSTVSNLIQSQKVEKDRHRLGLRKIVGGMGFGKKETKREKTEAHVQPSYQYRTAQPIADHAQVLTAYPHAPVQLFQVTPRLEQGRVEVPILRPDLPTPPTPDSPDAEQRHERQRKQVTIEGSSPIMTSEEFAESYKGLINSSPWEDDDAPNGNWI